MENSIKGNGIGIHWFRHDLRLHDLPSLSACLKFCTVLYPIYIFDEDEIICERIGYNRLRFILDALKDIDDKLRRIKGRLYVFKGKPTIILSKLIKELNITHLSYEHDIQPNWKRTESFVKEICQENDIEIFDCVSHTLWKIEDILKANGGSAPVTYDIFCHVAESLGPPPRPESDVSFEGITVPFIEIPGSGLPTCPEELGIKMECEEQKDRIPDDDADTPELLCQTPEPIIYGRGSLMNGHFIIFADCNELTRCSTFLDAISLLLSFYYTLNISYSPVALNTLKFLQNSILKIRGGSIPPKVWIGGETRALQHLEERLKIEEESYIVGYFMPNQMQPDLLGPPMSMSAAVSLGCLSVRRFYWSIRDLYKTINSEEFIPDGLVGQLIWREYFYAMCINNPYYAQMNKNPICLNIPWTYDKGLLNCWTEGQTGYPFIDAAMRQIRKEGWAHHVARNAVACFLTRGDLWISWEEGFKVFMKYLLDADLPVCAGNWMWVSSSAFETILQCPACISPISYGCHFEPSGRYIRKYVPELKNMPQEYIFQPWLAPLSIQESVGCIIGKDYPFPIIDHDTACAKNTKMMAMVKQKFLPKSIPKHCAPSNAAETRFFMCLPEKCIQNLLSHG